VVVFAGLTPRVIAVVGVVDAVGDTAAAGHPFIVPRRALLDLLKPEGGARCRYPRTNGTPS
jgi:hypothetical protein